MEKTSTIIFTVCITVFLMGFNILFSWTHESRIFGLILVSVSLVVGYYTYIKNKKYNFQNSYQKTSTKNIALALFLIVGDLIYNYFNSSQIQSLDQGVLLTGFIIIILNTKIVHFLKLTDEIISFSSNFLFITIVIYTITFLAPREIFFNKITYLTATTAAFFLSFIKETSTQVVINYPNLYNVHLFFDSSVLTIGTACSGVTSLTIFIASTVAYYFSSPKSNSMKLLIYSCIGIISFYLINVLRVILLILINYYYGPETMYFFHVNLGWLMFALGASVFWYLILKDQS